MDVTVICQLFHPLDQKCLQDFVLLKLLLKLEKRNRLSLTNLQFFQCCFPSKFHLNQDQDGHQINYWQYSYLAQIYKWPNKQRTRNSVPHYKRPRIADQKILLSVVGRRDQSKRRNRDDRQIDAATCRHVFRQSDINHGNHLRKGFNTRKLQSLTFFPLVVLSLLSLVNICEPNRTFRFWGYIYKEVTIYSYVCVQQNVWTGIKSIFHIAGGQDVRISASGVRKAKPAGVSGHLSTWEFSHGFYCYPMQAASVFSCLCGTEKPRVGIIAFFLLTVWKLLRK